MGASRFSKTRGFLRVKFLIFFWANLSLLEEFQEKCKKYKMNLNKVESGLSALCTVCIYIYFFFLFQNNVEASLLEKSLKLIVQFAKLYSIK